MAVDETTTTTGSVTRTTRTGTQDAQVSEHGSSGDKIHTTGVVPVQEVRVSYDQQILDPQAENAVQVEGQGGEGRLPDLPSEDVPHGGTLGGGSEEPE